VFLASKKHQTEALLHDQLSLFVQPEQLCNSSLFSFWLLIVELRPVAAEKGGTATCLFYTPLNPQTLFCCHHFPVHKKTLAEGKSKKIKRKKKSMLAPEEEEEQLPFSPRAENFTGGCLKRAAKLEKGCWNHSTNFLPVGKRQH
jgi:hypothetical protein